MNRERYALIILRLVFLAALGLIIGGFLATMSHADTKISADQLLERIKAERHKLIGIRAELADKDAELSFVLEEIIEDEHACVDKHKKVCRAEVLQGVKRDLEDEVAELHEELRVEGNKLQELIDQLAEGSKK